MNLEIILKGLRKIDIITALNLQSLITLQQKKGLFTPLQRQLQREFLKLPSKGLLQKQTQNLPVQALLR